MIESIKIINNDNSFTVYYKDKYAKELCWDEMLGLVASLTISDKKPCQQWLRTEEEHKKFEQEFNAKYLGNKTI